MFILRRPVWLARAAAMFSLIAAYALAAVPALEARAQSAMQTFSFGGVTLVALYDHPAAHDVNLFSGASREVIDSLVPSGLAASSVNAFLVQTGGKNVLIDTGMGAQSGAVSVEVQVTPNITVDSRVGVDNKQGVGVNWKWDY